MSAISAITFGDNLPGYEVGDKTAPAVIMIQEWWGVTEIIKRQAELLATRGYRVLIPDLYKGKVGVDAEEASHLMGALDFHAAVKEIGQAAKYLLESGSPKVGITGFCMGGALAFAAAEHVPDLTCTVPCYGTPKAEYFKVENIKIPVLGLFGDNDKHAGFADEATARAVEDKIKAAGGDVTIHIAKGGVHGFLNQLILPEGPPLTLARQGSITPEEEVTKAWEALVAFFDKHLK